MCKHQWELFQLKKIEKMWNLRKKIYFKYQNFFKNYDVGMQIINDSLKNYKHAYHLFVIYFRNTGKTNIRNKLIQFLKKK